jgi:hypothetical protein
MSIKIINESFIVALNSKDSIKLNESKLSDVNFDFKGLIRHNHKYKNLKVQLLDAVIPHSFYSITPLNNLLILDNIDYTIEAGNYTQKTLFDKLSRLKTKSGTYGVEFDKVTGKMTIFKRNDTNFTIQKESTMLEILEYEQKDLVGFRYSVIDNGVFTSYRKINATAPLYLAGNQILKISSKALACHNHDSLYNNTNNTLQFITVNSPPHSIIYYKNLSQIHFPMKEDYINNIDIQIYDENNEFINFNNTNWKIILSISYEKELFIDDVNFDDYKKKKQSQEDNTLGNIKKEKEKKKKEKEPVEEPVKEPVEEPVEEPIENIDIPMPTTNDNDLDLLLYNEHIYR